MRALKATVLAVAAALTLAAAPAPASAGPHWGGGGHWGGGWGHHGYWGGPGLAFGLAGAAIAAGVVAGECTRWVPTYDNFGNVVGRHPVNVC